MATSSVENIVNPIKKLFESLIKFQNMNYQEAINTWKGKVNRKIKQDCNKLFQKFSNDPKPYTNEERDQILNMMTKEFDIKNEIYDEKILSKIEQSYIVRQGDKYLLSTEKPSYSQIELRKCNESIKNLEQMVNLMRTEQHTESGKKIFNKYQEILNKMNQTTQNNISKMQENMKYLSNEIVYKYDPEKYTQLKEIQEQFKNLLDKDTYFKKINDLEFYQGMKSNLEVEFIRNKKEFDYASETVRKELSNEYKREFLKARHMVLNSKVKPEVKKYFEDQIEQVKQQFQETSQIREQSVWERLLQDLDLLADENVNHLLQKQIYDIKDIIQAKEKILNGIRQIERKLENPKVQANSVKFQKLQQRLAWAQTLLKKNIHKIKIIREQKLLQEELTCINERSQWQDVLKNIVESEKMDADTMKKEWAINGLQQIRQALWLPTFKKYEPKLYEEMQQNYVDLHKKFFDYLKSDVYINKKRAPIKLNEKLKESLTKNRQWEDALEELNNSTDEQLQKMIETPYNLEENAQIREKQNQRFFSVYAKKEGFVSFGIMSLTKVAKKEKVNGENTISILNKIEDSQLKLFQLRKVKFSIKQNSYIKRVAKLLRKERAERVIEDPNSRFNFLISELVSGKYSKSYVNNMSKQEIKNFQSSFHASIKQCEQLANDIYDDDVELSKLLQKKADDARKLYFENYIKNTKSWEKGHLL